MSSEREKTIIDNDVYNVIRTLATKLEGLAAYNKYSEDGGQSGQIWGQLKQQDEGAVRQLLNQLSEMVRSGRLQPA